MAIWILLLAFLLYAVFSSVTVWRSGVPGPWYNNVSSLVLKYQEWTRRRRQYVHRLHSVYGPVVRLAPNELSFANLEGLKEIYQSGGSGYEKTEFYDMFKQYDHRTMFSMLGREEHSQRKKLFAERYAMTNIARPDVLEGIAARAAAVVSKCRDSIGGHLDAYWTLHCYAIDGVSHLLFNPGGTDTLNDPKQREYISELTYYDNYRARLIEMYMPFIAAITDWFCPPALLQSQRYVLAQAEGASVAPAAVLHRLQNADLQPIQAAAECMDHMAAGIETTGDGLCFLMHELSLPRSRHIQEKLRAEFCQNPATRLDDLQYLDAVVREGLRRFPPIPMSLPRTIVSCSAYSLHLLNEDVFPDACVFRPERWLDKDKLPAMNRLFFTFSAGGRGCVGRNLALLEMKMLIREVYTRFRTSLPPEMQHEMEVDDQVVASRPKNFKALLTFEEAPI
ncbi:Isotrichodermin C-15 hydroxylase [Sphaceloma murrayae]|uniref:Isotrichodermin C-15 hydroxylase n=1 Tax=Sphaceloma murrayae TaxID=2082308 RepID=A0A2K1QWU6_9PEZI|nr:Isotrichodermin C-15 hydroxylase [Sphaceloma murrayae]